MSEVVVDLNDGGSPPSHRSPTAARDGVGKPRKADSPWMDAVRKCVLTAKLPAAEVKFVMGSARHMDVEAGQVLFEEGASPDAFYMVKSGRYSATRGGTKVRTYAEGDSFGAFEMLYPSTQRTIRVECEEGGSVWSLPQRVFDMKLKVAQAPKAATLELVKDIGLFSTLPKDVLVQLCRAVAQQEFKAGDSVCSQGDTANCLWAVVKGEVVTSVKDNSFQLTMRPPECFGESSLYADDALRIRQASVTAGEGGATLISLPVCHLENLIGYGLQDESVRLFNRKLLQSVSFSTAAGKRFLTKGMSRENADWLVAAMQENTYKPKAVVVADGVLDGATAGPATGVPSAQRSHPPPRARTSPSHCASIPARRHLQPSLTP